MVISSVGLLALTTLLLGAQAANPSTNADVSAYGFDYLGCYSDDVAARTLSRNAFNDMTGMTAEKCVQTCAINGYQYAGLEYAYECWCGSVIAPGSVSRPDAECASSCPGNTVERCGGSSRLSLYQMTGPIRDPGAASSSRSIASASASMSRSAFYASKSSYAAFVSSSQLAASLSRDSVRASLTSSRDAYYSSRSHHGSLVSSSKNAASLSRSIARSLYTSSLLAAGASRTSANIAIAASRSSVGAAITASRASSLSAALASISASRYSASLSRSLANSVLASSRASASRSRASLSLSVSASKASASLSRSIAASSVSASRLSASLSISSLNAYLSSSRSVALASRSAYFSSLSASKAAAARTSSTTTTTRTTTITTSITTSSSTTATGNGYAVTNPAVTTVQPAATLPASPICNNYDLKVVADKTSGNFLYEVYCDADIGGTDIGYPPGYGSANPQDFTACVDLCNIWNSQRNGYCAAIVFLGPGACYSKTNVYKQTNNPAGRGTQYQYYIAGHTVAQLLNQAYPSPTASKANAADATTSSSTTASTTTTSSSSTTTGVNYATYPAAVRDYSSNNVNPSTFCAALDNQVVIDNNVGTYEYQIYCDADIGGTDLSYPTGYSAGAVTNMLQCLDICNLINENAGGRAYCQAVVFLGAGACYPKKDVYKQTNVPAGRGNQYNYYVAGHTAAQILNAIYPNPTGTKATG